MSNYSNSRMIVFASILGAMLLATGLLALNPSTVENAKAEMYYDEYDDTYYNDDNNRYGYDNHQKKSSHTDIQKIKCVNSNINVNGIDITKIPGDTTTTAAANEGAATDATGAQNGNGWGDKINFNRNLVNICVNVNVNEQVKVSPPPDEEPPTCEKCFRDILDDMTINEFLSNLPNQPTTLEQYCDELENLTTEQQKTTAWLRADAALDETSGVSGTESTAVLDCLEELGLIRPLTP